MSRWMLVAGLTAFAAAMMTVGMAIGVIVDHDDACPQTPKLVTEVTR